MKRKIALALASILTISTLSGCGKAETILVNAQNGGEFERITSLPEQRMKSKQQVIDDNGIELSYMAASNLRRVDKSTTMDYNTVSSSMQERLTAAVSDTLAELNGKNTLLYDDSYVEAMENADETTDFTKYDRVLSTYNATYYLKNFFDNYKITGINPGMEMREFSGYYFVRMETTIAPNTEGTFKVMANYLGLDNCFIRDENRVFMPNVPWIIQSIEAVNKRREELKLEPHAVFIDSETAMSSSGTPIIDTIPVEEEQTAEETVAEDANSTENTTETAETVAPEVPDDTPEDVAYITNDISEDTSRALETVYMPRNMSNAANSLYTNNLRKLEYDVDEYEEVNGSSLSYTAMLPGLEMVYNPVKYAEGSYFEGDGCYKEGLSGLTNFEFNADATTGTATIVLIYKQDEYDKDKLAFYTAYVESLKPSNAFEETYNVDDLEADNFINVPNFVEEKILVKVEELDRLINNGDINGLMRHETIEDAGLALRYAEYASVADITTYSSKVQGVLASDGNVYLVKVKTDVTESVKDMAMPVSYAVTQVYVIRQSDLEFYINDIYVSDKTLTAPPLIEEVSQRYREIVNLNLADTMDDAKFDSVKEEIVNTLLNDWSYSANNKAYMGSEYVSKHYGLSKLLNSNREVLSEDRYYYIGSYMAKNLNLRPDRDDARLAIIVDKWLQGTEQQVEFTTRELFYYPNSTGSDSVGCYQECYYVVSHFRDMWVIDDIKYSGVEPNVTGSNLDAYLQEFNKNTNPAVIDSDACSDPQFRQNSEYLGE